MTIRPIPQTTQTQRHPIPSTPDRVRVREQELLLDMWRRNRKIFGVNDGQKKRDQGKGRGRVRSRSGPACISRITHDFGETLRKLLCVGCILCGSTGAGPNPSRCAQCHAVSYCSRACQKEDWKHHKVFCKTLKGGKWVALPISLPSSPQPLTSTNCPPINVHASWPFVIKIEDVSDSFSDKAVKVHDRSGSINLVLSVPSTTAVTSETLESLFTTPFSSLSSNSVQGSRVEEIGADSDIQKSGDKVQKVRRLAYRWARRTERTLEICIDKEGLDSNDEDEGPW